MCDAPVLDGLQAGNWALESRKLAPGVGYRKLGRWEGGAGLAIERAAGSSARWLPLANIEESLPTVAHSRRHERSTPRVIQDDLPRTPTLDRLPWTQLSPHGSSPDKPREADMTDEGRPTRHTPRPNAGNTPERTPCPKTGE